MSTEEKTGNVGEWAEPYVLLKLLADGKIYKSDENLNLIKEVFYDIHSVLLKKNGMRKDDFLEYIIEPDNRTVTVYSSGKPLLKIQRSECKEYAISLLDAIKNVPSHKGSKALPSKYTEYLEHIGRTSLKASSKDTPDIWLKLPDIRNAIDKPLGYSIKSDISTHPATIFNSSAASNVIYEITGDIDTQKIAVLRSLLKYSVKERHYYPDSGARIAKFKDYRLGLKYVHCDTFKRYGDELVFKKEYTFEKNLCMIDTRMPEILAAMVSDMYFNKIYNMNELVYRLNRNDPLNVAPTSDYPFYSKKVKDMLVAMTLSMVAGTIWDGSEGTNGGIIIVKEDGDLVCYHIFDRNDFKEFLLCNMSFEISSNTRHFSTYIWEEGGKYYLSLAVQVRMGLKKPRFSDPSKLPDIYELGERRILHAEEYAVDFEYPLKTKTLKNTLDQY